MVNSRDEKIRLLMREATDQERRFRVIQEEENSSFMNWKDEDEGQRPGTGTIIVRARKANQELGTKIQTNQEEAVLCYKDTKFIQGQNKHKTLGWFITNAILRPQYIRAIEEHQVKGDTFRNLTNNKPSNHLLGNATPYADHLVRFVTAARCNLLATPNNIAIWTGQEKPHCTCGKRENAHITLRHILNDCGYHTRAYMKRHNGIMQIIRDLITETTDVEIIAEDSTTDTGSNLKPDLVVKTQEQIIIIDATCPYGGSLLGQNENEEVRRQGRSLEKAFEAKIAKYTPLKETLRERFGGTIEILPIVVSALGAVYKRTASEIARIIKPSKKRLKKILRRLSKTAIAGSYEIWRQLNRTRNQNEKEGEDDPREARTQRDLNEDREEEETEEEHQGIDIEEDEDEDEEEEVTQEDIQRWPSEARILHRDTP